MTLLRSAQTWDREIEWTADVLAALTSEPRGHWLALERQHIDLRVNARCIWWEVRPSGTGTRMTRRAKRPFTVSGPAEAVEALSLRGHWRWPVDGVARFTNPRRIIVPERAPDEPLDVPSSMADVVSLAALGETDEAMGMDGGRYVVDVAEELARLAWRRLHATGCPQVFWRVGTRSAALRIFNGEPFLSGGRSTPDRVMSNGEVRGMLAEDEATEVETIRAIWRMGLAVHAITLGGVVIAAPEMLRDGDVMSES